MSEVRLSADDDEEDPAATERLCAATRVHLPVAQMIRFVAAPDGSVVADLRRRLPGRGVWIDGRYEAVERAVVTKAFARSLRRPVTVTGDLPDTVGGQLRKSALDSLSLANKAGSVVTGFAKIEDKIGAGAWVALVHASDAGEDGVAKLERAFRAVDQGGFGGSIRDFSIAELSLALGRPNVVHAALKDSGASSNFLDAARRLARYRERTDAIV